MLAHSWHWKSVGDHLVKANLVFTGFRIVLVFTAFHLASLVLAWIRLEVG